MICYCSILVGNPQPCIYMYISYIKLMTSMDSPTYRNGLVTTIELDIFMVEISYFVQKKQSTS